MPTQVHIGEAPHERFSKKPQGEFVAAAVNMSPSFVLLVTSLLVVVAHGNIVLFPWTSNDGSFGNAVDAVVGFGNSQPISTDCASALNQTIVCDPQM
jgi:hypothetical protein